MYNALSSVIEVGEVAKRESHLALRDARYRQGLIVAAPHAAGSGS